MWINGLILNIFFDNESPRRKQRGITLDNIYFFAASGGELTPKWLEHKQLIRIVKEPDLNSYALPGEPINEEDFKKWVEYAEDSPTVSFTEAKQRWAAQKKKLQKLIR